MKPAEEVIGAVGLSTMVVRPGDTCVAMGVSDLPILASSHIMHSMESASVAALIDYLEPGETTIVEKFEITMIDSVGIGAEVRCTARCIEVDGRELHFLCDLYDGERHIAQGVIKRKAVERVSYLARTAAQSLLTN
jgi:fluoroacetyl-CoA thioesterase